jgi:[protein-PII] uridylyltransferase
MTTTETPKKAHEIKMIKEKQGYRLNFKSVDNRIGILYKISAALYVQNWNIIELSAKTSEEGYIEDSFLIEPMEKRISYIMEYSLVSTIERLLKNDLTVMNYVSKYPKKWKNIHSESRKKTGKLDVSETDEGLIISIETEDRPGLIFEITQILYRLYFDIKNMESDTVDDKAIDKLLVKRDPEKSSKYDSQILKETLQKIIEA